MGNTAGGHSAMWHDIEDLSQFGVRVLWFLTTCAGEFDIYCKTLEYRVRIRDYE